MGPLCLSNVSTKRFQGMTIVNNSAAVAILTHAVQQLQMIGYNCLLSPLSLPQGMSLSLHVSETVVGALAANVATSRGAAEAHTTAGAPDFERDVAHALTEATIMKAAYVPPSD